MMAYNLHISLACRWLLTVHTAQVQMSCIIHETFMLNIHQNLLCPDFYLCLLFYNAVAQTGLVHIENDPTYFIPYQQKW